MRAVSLSNPKIIAMLNGCYVPVFLSNEDYSDQGSAPATEKAELHRIHREGLSKGLSVGSVHAFIIAPDGSVRDSMHTAEAAKADRLLAMLERNAKALNVAAGKPVVAPTAPPPPPCAAGDVQIYLIARNLQRSGNRLLPVQSDSGDWSALPSEEWLSLTPGDVRSLTKAGRPNAGTSWNVESVTVNKLLSHFYPPTENWEPETNVIRESNLSATLSSINGTTARITYTGKLKMDHWFYHKPDNRYVETGIEGYADVDPRTGRLLRFRLATDGGEYRGGGGSLLFGVAVMSLEK